MSDTYRTVTAKLTGVSKGAIFIKARRAPADISIPRSLIHGADETKVADPRLKGEEITFRLFDWKAEELGLA
jgi:hypothetical protein